MSPKAKVDIARDHLTKARADAADGDLRPKDLSGLHGQLNEERQAVFYDGAEPTPDDLDIDSVLADFGVTVAAAEAGAT